MYCEIIDVSVVEKVCAHLLVIEYIFRFGIDKGTSTYTPAPKG